MKQFITIIVTIALGLTIFLGGKWYLYVTNTESPYDEIGIELNSRLPGPINAWGCSRLRETFGNVVPPYGCQSALNAVMWREG